MNGRQFLAALEDVDSKLDAIIESLSFMATKAELEAVTTRLDSIEANDGFIKAMVAKHDLQLESHEERLAEFEALKRKYNLSV